MGRFVYCYGDTVWKYWFAIQDSNQAEIHRIMGVGEAVGIMHVQDPLRVWHILDDVDPEWESTECPIDEAQDGDQLILSHADIPVMEKWLKDNKHLDVPEYLQGGPMGEKFFKERPSRAQSAFWFMVQAYIQYMKTHPNEEDFVFEGEY